MSFDAGMLKYCGRQARLLRRVEQIIDERSGKMTRFKNPCIVRGRDLHQRLSSALPAWHLSLLARDPAGTGTGGVTRRASERR